MILTALYAVAFAATVSALSPPPVPGYQAVPIRYLTEIGKRTSFRYHFLTASGQCYPYKPSEPSIKITATNNVMDRALTVACKTLAKITKFMPSDVFKSTSRSGGVGIFTMAETVAAYPVNAALADRPQCYGRCNGNCRWTCTFDGRKWADVPGMTNSISLSNMESVLCMPRDFYLGTENIIVHEFAHLVHMNMDQAWKDKISAAYRNAQNKNLWQMNSYSMATEYEYFSVASETFLGSIKRTDTITTGGMNMCNSPRVCGSDVDSRSWLQKHDPMVYEVLLYAYTNNNGRNHVNIDPCEK